MSVFCLKGDVKLFFEKMALKGITVKEDGFLMPVEMKKGRDGKKRRFQLPVEDSFIRRFTRVGYTIG